METFFTKINALNEVKVFWKTEGGWLAINNQHMLVPCFALTNELKAVVNRMLIIKTNLINSYK